MVASGAAKHLDEPSTEQKRAFLDAFQRLIGEVFRLNGRLLAAADRLSQDLEIGPAGWQTVAVIRNEPMPVPQISRRLGLRRQSVQRTVNVLKGLGIVELRPNPAHKRAHLVKLTKKGQALMDVLRERQAELTIEFTRDLALSTEDLEKAGACLAHLREHAEQAAAD